MNQYLDGHIRRVQTHVLRIIYIISMLDSGWGEQSDDSGCGMD